jgi:enolase-phosphatase E1
MSSSSTLNTQVMLNTQPIKVLLLDVEGTTTRMQFVSEVLFPYAKDHLASYMVSHANTPALQALVTAIQAEVPHQSAELTLQQWMADDRKHPHLKTIQGWVWQAGYLQSQLKGHVYDDVPVVLAEWKLANKQVAIYSSGSVLAQQLLFRHSTAGDMTPYIDHYFDTAVGVKQSASSYTTIANTLGVTPSAILFASDIAEELEAAQQAGLAVVHLHRGDNPQFKPYAGHHWPTLASLPTV